MQVSDRRKYDFRKTLELSGAICSIIALVLMLWLEWDRIVERLGWLGPTARIPVMILIALIVGAIGGLGPPAIALLGTEYLVKKRWVTEEFGETLSAIVFFVLLLGVLIAISAV